jgi:predicted PurR-regulated permease PerM
MDTTSRMIYRWFVGVAIAALICGLMWYFRSVVVYILASAVLAIIGRPVVNALSSLHVGKFRVPRWASAMVTLVLMWVAIVGLCMLIVPLVVKKVKSLASLDLRSALSNIQQPLEQLQTYIEAYSIIPHDEVSLSEILINWLREVLDYGTINAAFSSVVDLSLSVLVVFFSVSFITFFFMKEEGLFYSMVTAIFPQRYKENVNRALDKVSNLLSRYFVGLVCESVILMVVVSVTMIAFGMNTTDACFIGVIMGVMNVIPYAGPLMGGIASMFIGVVSPIDGCTIGYTIGVIVGSLLVIKGLDDFVLQPLLYSERVKAHPLEVFIVILLAGSLAGIVGMLLAIPAYTVVRVFAKEFFSQFSLVKRLTENV